MKILTLHCDYIKFKAKKKALKSVRDLSDEEKEEKHIEECLVVLMAAEKGDSEKELKDTVDAIKKNAEQVNTKEIVVYPYAHLSSNLASPKEAEKYLEKTKEELEKEDFSVTNAPFGYYKEFGLKVKGHPLSELSKEFSSVEKETKTEGKEEVSEEKKPKEKTEEERKNLLKQVSRAKLDTEKLEKNDHRIIGQKMNLWSFHNVAPGMAFWHPKGLHLKNKLIELWREIHKQGGYEEISTPQIMDRKLWEISGHWTKYSENNFKTKYEDRDFLVKPMNCPGGMLVYKTTPKSYRDLPLRVGELGNVHRVELSGVLSGLFRVIQFTQDDAHIFCTEDQLEKEVGNIIDIINKLFSYFNLKIDHVELSTRPEKRIGTDVVWDFSEKALEKILKKRGMKYNINAGDGAFYGPKIDFHLKDSLGRTWQCSTIQMDMAMPERFNVAYVDEKGNEKRPIMVHRTAYGSLERFLGIITEDMNGKFPLWMSPNQIKILTLNENVKEYAKEIYNKFQEEGLMVELDDRNESMGKKARESQIQRFNYLITVGEKEKSEKNIAVKKRDEKSIKKFEVDDFLKNIKKEISEKII